MKRIWKIRPDGPLGILEKLAFNRGIAESEIPWFLDPRYETCHDPFLLRDMDTAAARIRQALEKNETISIYADYDADAVTAAAVLLRFFQQLGYEKVDYYIPDRFAEGYGVNTEAVKLLASRGTNLIITVDCGINAFESAELAKSLGIEMIITDHHQLTPHHSSKGEGVAVPRAVAVVNPHRPDDSYPDKDLTGVGVAFKLVQALIIHLQTTHYKPPSGFEKWLLDLVAIGTVADCQSLLGENRIFVKWGLLVLSKTRWIGLKKLMAVAGVDATSINSYHIAFMIAPRINAAGRIEHASLALDLLLTNDEAQADILSKKLNDLNQHRQRLTESIMSEAREQLAPRLNHKILLAAGAGWPKGIVGLVAGKLTEEFHKPVLVMEKGEVEATGSARSISGFNIIEAIGQSREILLRYGGHPQAAGFTLRSEHIEVFHKNLLQYADNLLSPEDLSPVLHYDTAIQLKDVNASFLDLLAKFEPFGQSNPRPKFRINNLRIKNVEVIGQEGKHLRLWLESEHQAMASIGFNLGFWGQKLQPGDKIDVICEPQYNEWNGQRTIQLKVIDLILAVSPNDQ